VTEGDKWVIREHARAVFTLTDDKEVQVEVRCSGFDDNEGFEDTILTVLAYELSRRMQ